MSYKRPLKTRVINENIGQISESGKGHPDTLLTAQMMGEKMN